MGAEVDEIIRSVIEKGFGGTQLELCERLSDYGLHLDQSAVSRALRRLGAEKKTVAGKRVYSIPLKKKHAAISGAMSDLVLSITGNEVLLVVKTIPGAAQFLASIIDHRSDQKAERAIIGTVAGDDTILVLPGSISEIKKALRELQKILKLAE